MCDLGRSDVVAKLDITYQRGQFSLMRDLRPLVLSSILSPRKRLHIVTEEEAESSLSSHID